MHAHLPVSALAMLTLAACSGPGPVVGGPCTYETSIIEGTARTVEASGVTFEGAAGEFFVTAEDLGALPAVGETLTLRRDLILTGTCTPEIYSVIAPAED